MTEQHPAPHRRAPGDPEARPAAPFVKPLVMGLLPLLGGEIVAQLQSTLGGWLVILLVVAVLLPLALWWGHSDLRSRPKVIRYGYPALAIIYVGVSILLTLLGNRVSVGWTIGLTAPIATAVIAVLAIGQTDVNLLHQIMGVALVGNGVALLGGSVAAIVGGATSWSVLRCSCTATSRSLLRCSGAVLRRSGSVSR